MTETHALPALVIAAEDYGRLAFIATVSMMGRRQPPVGAAVLADELVRASVVRAANVPSSTVTMRSTVEFRDQADGRTSRVTLVYPGEEDTGSNLISVLTPIGAALIGLSEGQSIRWRSADGGWRELTVLRVRQDRRPPEPEQDRQDMPEDEERRLE